MGKERKRKHRSSDSEGESSSSSISSSDDDRRRRRKHRYHEKKKRRKEKREKKRKHERKHEHRKSKKSRREDSEDLREDIGGENAAFFAREIIAKFPALAGEFKQLLQMVDSGQGVDVTGIPDENIRELLYKLFQSLKLSKVEQVYLLPDGSPPTLTTLAEVLKNVPDQPESLTEQKIDDDKKNTTEAGIGLAERPAARDNGEAGFHGIGPAEKPSAPPSAPARRVLGPAMPTADMFAAAAKLTEAEEELRKAEEELSQDPFVGPLPPAIVAEAASVNEAERFEEVSRILDPDMKNAYRKLGVKADATAEEIKKRYWKLSLLVHPDKCSHPLAKEAFTTINKAFQELQDPAKRAAIDHTIAEAKRKEEEEAELRTLREAAQWRRMRGEIALAGDDELLGTVAKPPTREEWMTKLPPERQAGRPTMHSTFFSKTEKTGRGDTSVWTDTPVEKAEKAKAQYLEAYKQATLEAPPDAEAAAESRRTSVIAKAVDEYNQKKRSESLVSKHQRDTTDKKKSGQNKDKVVEEWVGNHPWKPWNRDTDLAAGRKSVKLDASSMAKGLESRFGSSGTQRKFL